MIPRTAGIPKFRFHGAFPEPRRFFRRLFDFLQKALDPVATTDS